MTIFNVGDNGDDDDDYDDDDDDEDDGGVNLDVFLVCCVPLVQHSLSHSVFGQRLSRIQFHFFFQFGVSICASLPLCLSDFPFLT